MISKHPRLRREIGYRTRTDLTAENVLGAGVTKNRKGSNLRRYEIWRLLMALMLSALAGVFMCGIGYAQEGHDIHSLVVPETQTALKAWIFESKIFAVSVSLWYQVSVPDSEVEATLLFPQLIEFTIRSKAKGSLA